MSSCALHDGWALRDMTFTEFKDALGWSAKHKSAFEFMGETGDKGPAKPVQNVAG